MNDEKKKMARDVSVQLRCVRRLILQLQDDIGDLVFHISMKLPELLLITLVSWNWMLMKMGTIGISLVFG